MDSTEEKTIRLCGKCAATGAKKLRLCPGRSKKEKCAWCGRMRYTLEYREEEGK
ncbi:MAG: hypothetical protein LUE89_00065 [Clostridiales bacterium]|nr:hypothetical protein [Clostridiales bacterium]